MLKAKREETAKPNRLKERKMNHKRKENLIEAMQKDEIHQMLITDPPSIFYLTGKVIDPGERLLALLISLNEKPKLFINSLFPVKEDEDIDFVWLKDEDDAIKTLSNYIKKDKVLGIDKNWPAGFLINLMEKIEGIEVKNSSPLVDGLRMIKDQEEIAFMREASRINDEAMMLLIDALDETFTEKEMESKLLEIYTDLGAEGFSFTPIIAYGKNGADPHHENDDSLLSPGDSVIIDIGCYKDQYASDMTRTVFYKKASPRAEKVYNTVLKANQVAISKIKPGVSFSEIDLAARKVIEDEGFGDYFTHRTGHHIGIEVHEKPDVSSSSFGLLEEGMIFSVEPGIYLEGELGVRIEDLLLVTKDGVENLNKYGKALFIKP